MTTYAEVLEQLVDVNRRIDAAAKACAEKDAEIERLRGAIAGFVETARAAVAAHRRPQGGQQVPFHGDFAHLPPSAVRRLEWWAEFFAAALGTGDAPSTDAPCPRCNGTKLVPDTSAMSCCPDCAKPEQVVIANVPISGAGKGSAPGQCGARLSYFHRCCKFEGHGGEHHDLASGEKWRDQVQF